MEPPRPLREDLRRTTRTMPPSGGNPPPTPPPAQEAAASEDEQQQREAVGKVSDGDADKDGHEEARENLLYLIPFESKTAFAVPDLVWGKVTGFPWWPGQILDPSYASRNAMKLRKEGRFLVAYFGDRTFAWCRASQLKPFLSAYGEMVNQSPSRVFPIAVEEVVAEASRRVEIGMVCSCVPQELYSNVKYQIAENAGIRKGVAIATTDATFGPSAFVPGEFLDYVRALAVCPKGESDRLDIMLVRAHLMAYRRSQGVTDLCGFSESKGLVENDDITGDQESLVQAPSLIPKDESILSGNVAGSLHLVSNDEEKLSDFISRKLGRKTWMNSCRKMKSGSGNGKSFSKPSKTSECKNGSSTGDTVSYKKPKESIASPDIGKSSKKKRKTSERKNGSSGRAKDTVSDKKSKESTASPFDLVESSKKKPKTSARKNSSTGRVRDTVSDKKRKELTASPFDLVESSKKKPKLLDNAVKKSPSPVPYQSFKVGEFIRRFASKLTNPSPTLESNGGTLQKRKLEDKLSVGHKSERGDSASTSSSSEVQTSEKNKSRDGMTCSFDEVTEPPGEIKYSRRPKRGHGLVEDQTPPKEIKYSRRFKVRHVSMENTAPPNEIRYSRRHRPRQSSEDDSDTFERIR